MELDKNSRSLSTSKSYIPQGSPLSPVLFHLTCTKILTQLLDGCNYVDACKWSIVFDSLSDKNELAWIVQRLLHKIQSVFWRYGMELDEKHTKLRLIYKANQNCKQWDMAANRWSTRWRDKTIYFNKRNTQWLGYHLERYLNWHILKCEEILEG
jgi:lysylphosphatidylglycerol synthetase-like protein (DUF2156 family)